jgi:hypothetical protein
MSISRFQFDRLFVISVGVLLMVAAVLKSLTLFADGLPPSAIVFAFTATIIFLELTVGLSLVTDTLFRPHVNLLAIAGLFFVFSIWQFSLYQVGDDSCGCFGPVIIPPIAMAIFDVVIAATAFTLSMNSGTLAERAVRSGLRTLGLHVFVLFSAAFIVLLAVYSTKAPTLLGSTTTDPTKSFLLYSKDVVAIDNRIIGSKIDYAVLLNSEIAPVLAADTFLLVIVRDECAKCSEFLVKLANTIESNQLLSSTKVVVVSVGDDTHQESIRSTKFSFHRANNTCTWNVATPFIVESDRGIARKRPDWISLSNGAD